MLHTLKENFLSSLLWFFLVAIGAPLGYDLWHGLVETSDVISALGLGDAALLLIMGLFIGLGQWLALRERLNITWIWIPATGVGLSLGCVVSYWMVGFLLQNVLSLPYDLYLRLAPLFALMGGGLLTGALQRLALHRVAPTSPAWLVVSSLSFACSYEVAVSINDLYWDELGMPLMDLLGIHYLAIIFGLALALPTAIAAGMLISRPNETEPANADPRPALQEDRMHPGREAAFPERTFYWNVLTLRFRTHTVFYLLLMLLFGVLPFLPLLYGTIYSLAPLIFGDFSGGVGLFSYGISTMIAGAITINFLLSILEILKVIPPLPAAATNLMPEEQGTWTEDEHIAGLVKNNFRRIRSTLLRGVFWGMTGGFSAGLMVGLIYGVRWTFSYAYHFVRELNVHTWSDLMSRLVGPISGTALWMGLIIGLVIGLSTGILAVLFRHHCPGLHSWILLSCIGAITGPWLFYFDSTDWLELLGMTFGVFAASWMAYKSTIQEIKIGFPQNTSQSHTIVASLAHVLLVSVMMYLYFYITGRMDLS